MFILKTLIYIYTSKKGGELYACFIDFSKAFDTVWRQGLLLKLLRYGICGKLYGIIKSMYKEVRCCVKTKDALSPFFVSNFGVKQGEILCCLIYI